MIVRAAYLLIVLYVAALVLGGLSYLLGVYPASWIVSLSRSGHPPITGLELALVWAFFQAVLAVPACPLAALVLRARAPRGTWSRASRGSERPLRALRGVAILSLVAGWCAVHALAPSLYPFLSWVADGVSVALLVFVPLGVVLVLDTLLPFEVIEGVVSSHVEFGRPGRVDTLLRVGPHFLDVPHRVWSAVPAGAHVRVTRWAFSDRFVALERAEGPTQRPAAVARTS